MIKWHIVIPSWICAALAASAMSYVMYSGKEAKRQAAETKIDAPVDKELDAILRGHPNSHMVCKVPGNSRSYLVHYNRKYADDGFPINWYYLKDVELLPAGNGTYFITNLSSNYYTIVYPDIKGLTCKEQVKND